MTPGERIEEKRGIDKILKYANAHPKDSHEFRYWMMRLLDYCWEMDWI